LLEKTGRVKGWRLRWHEIIFEAETPAGRRFDVVLLWAILLNVALVMLETVPSLQEGYGTVFHWLEWGFTGLFTLEYLMRLATVRRPLLYATSFFGLVDLAAIVPTFLGLLIPGSHSLRVIRILRLLRVFRVLKLGGFLQASSTIAAALRASRAKITVFLTAVLALVTIVGTVMYLVEGPESEFTSIPKSIYWAIVTVTTVGYGDIAPASVLGQILASAMMVIGYAIIAVPTGIVGMELARGSSPDSSTRACDDCGTEGHRADASYCYRCGAPFS
jgi:voltage-gated potassium channel